MSDQLKGVVVTFAEDIKEAEAQSLLDAIAHFKGVLTVTPSLATPDDFMNRERIYWEMRRKLLSAFNDPKPAAQN